MIGRKQNKLPGFAEECPVGWKVLLAMREVFLANILSKHHLPRRPE